MYEPVLTGKALLQSLMLRRLLACSPTKAGPSWTGIGYVHKEISSRWVMMFQQTFESKNTASLRRFPITSFGDKYIGMLHIWMLACGQC